MKNIFALLILFSFLLQSCTTGNSENQSQLESYSNNVEIDSPDREIIKVGDMEFEIDQNSESTFLYDMEGVEVVQPSFKSRLSWTSNIKKCDYGSPNYAKIMVHQSNKNTVNSMEEALKKPLEVKTLFLVINNLKELPIGIEKLQNLERLALESANFTNFAKDVERLSKLPNLKTLQLKGCNLRTLPKNINLLKNLEIVYLGFNPIQSLPDEFCELENLLFIDFYNATSLKELPPNFGNLKNLEFLGITGTGISTFPESIENCDKLLCITANAAQIEKLPSTFGGLENLCNLNLGYNGRVKELPASFVNLKHLTNLNLQDNKLSSLPSNFDKLQNLTHLNLNGNQFNIFPASLLNLSNLMQVDILENNVNHIPYAMAKAKNIDIIMYDASKISQSNIDSIKQLNSDIHLYSDYNQMGSLLQDMIMKDVKKGK